jgi:hypothetical protein
MDGPDCAVKKRKIFGRIELNGYPVGGIEIVAFDIEGCFDNDDVLYCLDIDSGLELQLAEVLCEFWDNVVIRVGIYGPIVDFRRVWVSPKYARGAVWAAAANRILSKEFGWWAMLVMKAYPLEYEGKGTAEFMPAIEARQRAMIRYYARLFGVAAFPGKPGREGWLYAIPPRLMGIVDPPAFKRRRARRRAAGERAI